MFYVHWVEYIVTKFGIKLSDQQLPLHRICGVLSCMSCLNSSNSANKRNIYFLSEFTRAENLQGKQLSTNEIHVTINLSHCIEEWWTNVDGKEANCLAVTFTQRHSCNKQPLQVVIDRELLHSRPMAISTTPCFHHSQRRSVVDHLLELPLWDWRRWLNFWQRCSNDISQFYIMLKQMDKMTSCENEFPETHNLRKFSIHVLMYCKDVIR